MREIVFLHIGQAGNQLATACWELFCTEHGVKYDGTLEDNPPQDEQRVGSIFRESESGRHVPRGVLFDLEPSVIDQLRNEKFRELFHPEMLITGKEDAANIFSRGSLSLGAEMLDSVMEKIRRQTEPCDSLQGFLMTHAAGGGTGSGFSSLLSYELRDTYEKMPQLDFCVWPSPHLSTAVVEPYNAVLTTHMLLQNSDVVILLDNEAIYRICKLGLGIERPFYSNLNELIAQVTSSVTASIRFNGSLNTDIRQLQMNLVPYPRIHFLVCSCSPISTYNKLRYEKLSAVDLTTDCFRPSRAMAMCDLWAGKFMACCLMYRGDVVPRDINTAIAMMKKRRRLQFVDWSPTGFKCGINPKPISVPKSGSLATSNRNCTMLANTTAIAQIFSSMQQKFDLMYNRRAFITWWEEKQKEEEE